MISTGHRNSTYTIWRKLLLPLLLLVVMVSCNRRPSNVLSEKKMAEVLSDIHTAEGVIEINRGEYHNDSVRKALRQSIYLRHKVTREQVDTSLVWYGAHQDKYNELYNHTIEILEKRLAALNHVKDGQILVAEGDSTDIWMGSRHLTITPRVPSQFITFDYKIDENSRPGDRYRWRAKLIHTERPVTINMVVDYEDGLTEWITQTSTSLGEGWHVMELMTDSTKVAKRVYGNMNLYPGEDYSLTSDQEHPARSHALYAPKSVMYVDSIELVRTRVKPELYIRRSNINKIQLERDTTYVRHLRILPPAPVTRSR